MTSSPIPKDYIDPRSRPHQKSGIFLNFAIILLLFVWSHSYLQTSKITTISLQLGIIGIWRHCWGITNFIRAVYYRRLCLADESLLLAPIGNLVIVVTFYNQTEKETQSVTLALSKAVKNLPQEVLLVFAHLTDEQRTVATQNFKSMNNAAIHFVRQHRSGKREALADCLNIAKKIIPHKRDYDSFVLLIDGDTVVTENAIVQSMAQLQRDSNLGAVIVNEIPYCRTQYPFAVWRMLRSLERDKVMSSFSLSGRVLVLTGRFAMFRDTILLRTEVISRIRKDFVSNNGFNISLLTGDDKTTWLEVLSRGYKMKYLPYANVFPIENPNLNKGFLRGTFALSQRYSGNMARANLHPDAWKNIGKNFHFAYGLFDQRISMWTALLTPLLLLYLLLLDHFGIFVIVTTYVLFVKHIQAISLWALSGTYDPWYPYLIFYNQIMTASVKVQSFAFLHRQIWTNQSISQSENSTTKTLDKMAKRTLIARIFLFVSLFSLLYVYLVDKQ